MKLNFLKFNDSVDQNNDSVDQNDWPPWQNVWMVNVEIILCLPLAYDFPVAYDSLKMKWSYSNRFAVYKVIS